MARLPSSTLTLLFSDIEESTALLEQVGPRAYAALLDAHGELVRGAVAARGGAEVDSQGDSFFCVFSRARDAATAAISIQQAHARHDWPGAAEVRVRVGLHTGEPLLASDRYVGMAVHRAARIMAAAHGGQVLVSEATAHVLGDDLPEGISVVGVGEYRLKGLTRPQRLSQLIAEGLPGRFPPPRADGGADGSDSEGSGALEFRLLGPVQVLHAGREMPLAGAKQQALLALLLLNANTVVSTEQLIDGVWGTEPPESGAKAVQVRVSQLRRALEGAGFRTPVVLTRGRGYIVEVGDRQLDLRRFERLVGESDAAFAEGDPERAGRLLDEALGLWRGEPLSGLGDIPFAAAARSRLAELRLAAIERRIEADLATGRHADVVAELETLISSNPYRERLRRQLMLALYRSGRQAEALAAYQDTRRVLVDELGIEPSQALQELERAILAQDTGLEVPGAGATQPGLMTLEAPSAPDRSILVAPGDLENLAALLAIAEPLTRRPRREVIVGAVVADARELAAATAELEAGKQRLAQAKVAARVAAFTSDDRGTDLVRLASEQDVDLLLVDAHPALLVDGSAPDDLQQVWLEAPCDVAVLISRPGAPPGELEGPVVVPFGGGEHEWAAVELGAWLAVAHGVRLTLLGAAATAERGKRDASRLLASVSLVVQRATGVTASPLLVQPGEDSVAAAIEDVGCLVLGLSDRWSREGLGSVRLSLARRRTAPTLVVRRGSRPGVVPQPERLTRYTWSVSGSAAS